MIFGSNTPERTDSETFPERILIERIELMAEDMNEKIEGINNDTDVDLPSIDSIPTFDQAVGIDHKIADKYDSVSADAAEDRYTRRRLINARQKAQELRELYLTFYSISEPAEGFQSYSGHNRGDTNEGKNSA